MKISGLLIGLVLLGCGSSMARAQDVEPLRMHDAKWIRDAGDRLARCAGIYRGAAAIMRDGGRAAGADYADNVATGALFAAYLLLTSAEAKAASVLNGIDANVHLDALVWATKRNFIGMETEGLEQATLLRECTTRTSALQSAVLRSSWDAPAAATTAGRPKS